MGFFATEKEETKSNKTGGLLLVFFPDQNNNNSTAKQNPLCSSSSSSSSSPSSSSIRRTRSSSRILSRAQSTISICAILVFLTLFLFTLSTFEPPLAATSTVHRRFLIRRDGGRIRRETHAPPLFALQGMGTLFLRGTRAMHDLVVAHVGDDVIDDELRLFLRLVHWSGVSSRSDVVLIFGSGSRFDGLIREENDSFLKLVDSYRLANSRNQASKFLGFDPTRFLKDHGAKDAGESLWGKRAGGSYRDLNESATNETESTRLSYGSVVGFDAGELDPENSLSGFLDRVPITLRRWACYPMLLGRVRHNFKHVTLVDARNALFLGDPFTRIRNRSPESILVFPKQHQHTRKNSDRNRTIPDVIPAVITGGAKGVRRLSNAMLTEIVRAAVQHKKKNSVSESNVLSQLVGKDYITKNFQVAVSTGSIPEASSLTELKSRNSVPLPSSRSFDMILRGNSNYRDINALFTKHICSFNLDSSIYSDCFQ